MLRRASLTVVVALSACQDPTELKFVVTTDFDCGLLAGGVVGARLGASFSPTGPVTTTSQACKDRSVGTLVVTPSGNGSRVTVEAIAAVAPASLDGDGNCGEGTAGCIHARRSLNFVSHHPLTIPMLLSLACAGVVCPADQTCVSGGCVPNAIDGNDCTTTDCTLPPPDGGAPRAYQNDCGAKYLSAAAPVPMVGVCPDLRGYEPLVAPASAPTKMPLNAAFKGFGHPVHVLLDGKHRAFVSTSTASVIGIDLQTGAKVGQVLANRAGVAPMLLAADGFLYTTMDGMSVLQVDPATLAPGRSILTQDGVSSAFNVSENGQLVFTGSTGLLQEVAFTATATSQSVRVDGSGVITPMIASGSIWQGASGGHVTLLDATTLGVIAQATFGTTSVPSLAGAPDGPRAIFLSSPTCAIAWLRTPTMANTSPVPESGVGAAQILAVLPDATTYVTTSPGMLVTTSDALYQFDAAIKPTATPPLMNGAAFPAVDKNGSVLSSDPQTGALALYDRKGAMVWAAPAAHGSIYATAIDWDGTIVALDATSDVVWIYPP